MGRSSLASAAAKPHLHRCLGVETINVISVENDPQLVVDRIVRKLRSPVRFDPFQLTETPLTYGLAGWQGQHQCHQVEDGRTAVTTGHEYILPDCILRLCIPVNINYCLPTLVLFISTAPSEINICIFVTSISWLYKCCCQSCYLRPMWLFNLIHSGKQSSGSTCCSLRTAAKCSLS